MPPHASAAASRQAAGAERPFFPDKAALGAMQDRFYGRVGALYGLSRGEKRIEGEPARRHKSVAEYKAESRRVQAELDEKAEQLEAAREELASTRAQLAECRSRILTVKSVATTAARRLRESSRVNVAMRDHGGGEFRECGSRNPRSRIAELTRRAT